MSGHQRKPLPQSRQQAGNLAPKPLPYRPQPSGPPRQPLPIRQSPRIPSKSISKGALIAIGIPVYVVAAYSAYLYQSYRRAIVESQSLDVPLDVSDRYDKIAKTFDNEVGFGETIIGLGFLRKWMGGMARGHVLEVSAGTGRNLQYYPLEKCKSITCVDASKEMLDEAKKKFKEFHPDYANVCFLVQDATTPISPRPKAEFDTIIQTMGLCSTPRPVELLKGIGSICSKDGQILLLEHGRSHYQWMNNMLDNLAPAHANRFGCWWNRDIGKIVDESGLEVVKVKRYHLGTTWWIELRPVRGQKDSKGNMTTTS